jgi:pSer/pThr/pTyr-binding forkhead associated (FHA) protein
MGHEKQAMLFAPPEPPLRLDPARELVIGRSRSCELTLPVGEASRRHAMVRFEDGDFRVRDLGSTNGTFVNGEPLGAERVLRPGDRIEIGGVSLTFFQMDEAADEGVNDPGDGDTVLMLRPSPEAREALSGSFEQIPPFAVLQILEMGRHTGLLSVEGTGGSGGIWLEEGRLIHAESEKGEGLDAAIEMAQDTSGRFLFEPGGAPAKRSVDASVTEVILEASRLLDEAALPPDHQEDPW